MALPINKKKGKAKKKKRKEIEKHKVNWCKMRKEREKKNKPALYFILLLSYLTFSS